MKHAEDMPVDQAALDVLAERFRLLSIAEGERARIESDVRAMLGGRSEERDQLIRLAAGMIDMIGRMDAGSATPG